MNGALVYQDYELLIKNKNIISKSINKTQIQPSSLDLSLSESVLKLNIVFYHIIQKLGTS